MTLSPGNKVFKVSGSPSEVVKRFLALGLDDPNDSQVTDFSERDLENLLCPSEGHVEYEVFFSGGYQANTTGSYITPTLKVVN